MGHGHIFLDFPYFQVLDLEKTNFVWKQVSKPPCKLLVENKQHKQLIDRAKMYTSSFPTVPSYYHFDLYGAILTKNLTIFLSLLH